ncbi:carbohydrate kinase family protein [Nocardia sp. NPDC046763]|uniref:carbohydrate kinase family protein n=1 Tax=Nocardia sp. NPDC046763 TaxID=3155256 RepID=UPI0033DD1289
MDVVGIGALNLDYLTSQTEQTAPADRLMTDRLAELLADNGQVLELGTEIEVNADTIHAAIEIASAAMPTTVLGGSAFNAIHAIAATRTGLRLGYVGIAGRSPADGSSILDQLDALAIDRTFVAQDETVDCGICFSLIEGDARTLLTHVGANTRMSSFLEQNFDDIVAYLSSARLVHVTSFLDAETAAPLLAVISAVERAGTGTVICFDPGHIWSVERSPEVVGIIRASDFLLVNNREFREIGRFRAGDTDEEVAGRILDEFESPDAVVVVKLPTGIRCFLREGDGVIGDFYARTPLPEHQIRDSTGAGDVFAGGLLTVLASDRSQIELGCLLGMALARYGLGHVGTTGFSQFASVTRQFIPVDQQLGRQ